jgi:hypothetical protein
MTVVTSQERSQLFGLANKSLVSVNKLIVMHCPGMGRYEAELGFCFTAVPDSDLYNMTTET